MSRQGFATRAVHAAGPKADAHHALRFPTYDGAAFGFESAEVMADTFSGRRAAHAYPDCPVCGDHPVIVDLIDYEQKACEIKR